MMIPCLCSYGGNQPLLVTAIDRRHGPIRFIHETTCHIKDASEVGITSVGIEPTTHEGMTFQPRLYQFVQLVNCISLSGTT